MNSPIKSNKILWDRLADLHIEDPWYKLDPFLKGETTLMPPELELLTDVSGKSVLHLQCHFGLDSLSLTRLGAHVTGVDLSERAILKARELAGAEQLDARFICAPLHELEQTLTGTFDLVFTSYGVLDWLPDLADWARLIASYLRPGGQLVLVEFHPFLNCFDLESGILQYPYFADGKPITEQIERSYTGTPLGDSFEMNLWAHELGEIFSSLLHSGLTVTHFREYDYSPFDCLQNLRERSKNEFVWKENESLPMLFSLTAEKNG